MKIIPPTAVLVGRTNVGKSTLFNKFIEDQKSLVSDIAGTTRDRFEANCLWKGRIFRLVDTGGLNAKSSNTLEAQVHDQAQEAIKKADVIIFVTDIRTGIQKEDRELALEFTKLKKPILLVANKADNVNLRARIFEKEWHTLSIPNAIPVSARRGMGSGDLLDEIFSALVKNGTPPVDIADIVSTRVCVIGRPNVGKSSLLNSILGENRFITNEIEHTTREPNDAQITVNDKNYTFIDTAGIRKMSRIHASASKLEETGVEKSIISMKRSHVVLFTLDISKHITSQDKHLAGAILEAGASAIIIANKWDLIEDKDTSTINQYEDYIRANFPMLDFAPIIFTSALTGKRVQNVFKVIDAVYKNRFTQLRTEETKEFISRAIAKHKPSRGKGVAHPDIRSFLQVKVNPPTFVLNIRQQRTDSLADSYLRFLENLLRDQFDFAGVPIKILVRGRKKSHTT